MNETLKLSLYGAAATIAGGAICSFSLTVGILTCILGVIWFAAFLSKHLNDG